MMHGEISHSDAAMSSTVHEKPPRGPLHFERDEWLSDTAIDARPILPKVAFFMGDMRDGLPMLNMQAAFLISSKSFTEKQVGVLFFVFSLFQFLALAPAGYLMDYSNRKIEWVIWAGCGCSTLTVITALAARDFGENMALMIVLKMLQGCLTAILPPGFNGITLGIVGLSGFTHQVSRNRMMNHTGTALIVAVGSLIAYFLFPNIGQLFIVSPIAAIGLYYNLRRIRRSHINTDAARSLIITSPTMTEYEHMDEAKNLVWRTSCESPRNEGQEQIYGEDKILDASPTYITPEKVEETKKERSETTESTVSSEELQPQEEISQEFPPDSKPNPKILDFRPSFNFAWARAPVMASQPRKRAQSPLTVLMGQNLLVFTAVVFFFHLANSSVLPLVMQSLSLKDPQAGILLSGLCIVIAQAFMTFFAKLCGDYSPIWGRKRLFITGLASLPIRCFLLVRLVSYHDKVADESDARVIKALILSTQLLDSVGAGIFGTLYVLITNDISIGSGRFSLMLGITTGAMCLGGTISGYLGQAFASDYGYPAAFRMLGIMSLIPLFIFTIFVPETLPDYARPKPKRRKNVQELLRHLNERRKVLGNPFTPKNSSTSLQAKNAPSLELV